MAAPGVTPTAGDNGVQPWGRRKDIFDEAHWICAHRELISYALALLFAVKSFLRGNRCVLN